MKAEEDVIHELEKQYKAALNEINQKVKLFEHDILMLDNAINTDGLDETAKAVLQSQKRSKVYQKQFQTALQGQINAILDRMQGNNYSTLQEYLNDAYTDAFIGTMYDIQGQGIPLIMPIDQAAAVKAIMTDSKISKGLYTSLGVDVKGLKKAIRQEITRGIGSGLLYNEIARNISNVSKAPLARAKTVAKTECHRIQQRSTDDARKAAIKRGCDLVKQWSSTLDGKTRDNHRRLDGQIREEDEPFEIGGNKAMFPGDFGDPAEDCNCRCVALTRAKWALDEDELQTLKERAEYFGLDKTKDFEDFKEKYLQALEKIQTGGQILDYYEWDKKRTKIATPVYETIRNQDDIAAVAKSSGFSKEDIETIKLHVFVNKHIMYDGDIERFVPSYDMAVAWNRLVAGNPEERDILLLKHELLESQVEKKYNLTASEAHAMAKAKYNWEQKLFDDVGDGEPDGLL